MRNIPQFGNLLTNAKDRPGAYAVISNDLKRILIVIAKNRYHLPGGGIDAGEDPQQAVAREIQEETGYSIEGLQALGQANQFLDTKDLGPINKLGLILSAAYRALRSPRPTPLITSQGGSVPKNSSYLRLKIFTNGQ